MGRIKQLVKNLKYISKYNLKKHASVQMDLGDLVENILYYMPNSSVMRPRVMNTSDTLDVLLNTNKSIARFGDGEILLINGHGIAYQEYDPMLAMRMRKMLENTDENIMIGINYSYFWPKYNPNSDELNRRFELVAMPKFRADFLKIINMDTQYYDAGFSGMRGTKNSESDAFFDKLRTIWSGRDVVLVDNVQLRQKMTHDLFDNAKSKTYVDVPNKHSFREYENVLVKLKQFPTDTLIVLMAGPLSKVLVADLSPLGYRALDLGHVAKAYDWYCSGVQITAETAKAFCKPD